MSAPDAVVAQPFPYAGPEELRAPVIAALGRVVDPELAMAILDVGLVVGVRVDGNDLQVLLTMTSAACPVADVIVDDAWNELTRGMPASFTIDIQLVWEPEWTAARMSDRARRFMGW